MYVVGSVVEWVMNVSIEGFEVVADWLNGVRLVLQLVMGELQEA
jgi:hypothetical protein